MKNLLAVAVLIAGLALAAFGAMWIWTGLDIVQVERGWSAVIAGAAMLAGGVVTAAISIAILRLNEIARLLATTRTAVAAPVVVPELVAPAPIAVAPAITPPAEPALAMPVPKASEMHDGDGPLPVRPPSHVGLPGEPEFAEDSKLELAAAEPEPLPDVENIDAIDAHEREVEEAFVPRPAPPVFIPEIAFSKPFAAEPVEASAPPLPDAFAAAFPPLKPLRETPAYTSPLSAIVPPEPEMFAADPAEPEPEPEPEAPDRRGLVLPKLPERPTQVFDEPVSEPAAFEPPEYRPAAGGEDILPVFPAQSKAWVNASKAAAPPAPAEKAFAAPPETDGLTPVFPPSKTAVRPAPKVAPRSDIVGTHESGDTTYVMFADGSIEARTVDGSMHFKDLTSLKTYVERETLKSA